MKNEVNIEKIEQYVIDKVKEIRTAKGISQRELAARLDVSEGFIANVENKSYRAKYNLKHINALARILTCSPRELLPKRSL
jgi:transcriptional regulator with XRE-family HTH domain